MVDRSDFTKLEYVMDSHFMLKLMFLFLSVISIVVALNLAVGFENEYLESATGPALHQYAGTFTYITMFIMFIYFLIWIIYKIFKNKMLAELNEEE